MSSGAGPAQYRVLGGTGIWVSELALGTMMFGAFGNTDHDACVSIIRSALDGGINFVDTADIYSLGESEEIVGKAIKGRRDDVVLATKSFFHMGSTLNSGGSSRRHLTEALHASLRRLGTDYIDLYQVHRPDPYTDLDETLGALSDFVRAGKVRAIGVSGYPAELVVEALWLAERGGHARVRTHQPPYSIFNRAAEAAILPTAQKHGMGVLTWSPLSAGWLTGRIRTAEDATQMRRYGFHAYKYDPALPENQKKLAAIGPLGEIADGLGVPLSHVAIGFVLSHPAVTSAIIGPRTQEQLDDLLRGASLRLDDSTLDKIDAIVPPGADLNPADADWTPRALAEPRLRRIDRSAPRDQPVLPEWSRRDEREKP